MSERKLRIGKTVMLVNQGGGKYTVSGVEKHNGLNFYRLSEVSGLFLRSSLLPEREPQ